MESSGYQPTETKLDRSNPPKQGSGVSNKCCSRLVNLYTDVVDNKKVLIAVLAKPVKD